MLPRQRRLEILLILGAFAAMGPIGMDMYIPALPATAADLGVTTSPAQLTITTFLLGVALGQVVVGPLSDVVGRRLPLMLGAGMYAAAALACGTARSVTVLAAGRFALGVAAAAGIVISRAIIRDLYTGKGAARSYSRLFFLVAFSAVLSPIVGTQLLRITSWRAIFLVYFAFGALLLLVAATRLPETLPAERRSQKGLRLTLRNLGAPLHDRRFVGYTVAFGGMSGALILMLSGSPFVLESVYGTSPQFYGYLIFASALTMMVATQLNVWLIRRVSSRRVLESALICTVLGGIVISTTDHVGLWGFCMAFLVVLAMWGFVAANAISLAMRDQFANAGAAAAHVGLAQYGTGAIAAPLTGLLGTDTAFGVGIALSSLALVGCCAALMTGYGESGSG